MLVEYEMIISNSHIGPNTSLAVYHLELCKCESQNPSTPISDKTEFLPDNIDPTSSRQVMRK